MRKLFKIAGWIFLSIIGLMLIASALLIVNKENIKRFAIEEINQYMNKRIHVGFVDLAIWKTFPNLTIDFQNVLIHDKFNDFQTADTTLYADHIRLRFDPIEILKGNYTLERIDVIDGAFNMQIREDGSINYDLLRSIENSDTSSFELDLEHIHIQNTAFKYNNQSTQQLYTTHIEEMDLQGEFEDETFELSADTDFNILEIKNKSILLLQDKHAKLHIDLLVNSVEELFEIQTADLSINKLPFYIKGSVIQNNIDFQIGSHQLPLQDFVRNFQLRELDVVNDLQGTGIVDIDMTIKGVTVYNQSPAIDAQFNIINGSLKNKELALSNINVLGHYSNGVLQGEEQIKLEQLNFSSLNSQFQGSALVTEFDRPRIKGKMMGNLDLKAFHLLFASAYFQRLEGILNTNGTFDVQFNNPTYDITDINVRNLSAEFGLNQIIAHPIYLRNQLSIPEGMIVIRNQEAILKNVQIQTGTSDLEIDGVFDHIVDYFNKSKTLAANAFIESHQLNIADFSTPELSASATLKRQWILPKDIAGKLNLKLSQLNYSSHNYSGIETVLEFGNRTLYFPKLKGENANAFVEGDLLIEEKQPMQLTVNTHLRSDNITFDALFKEWNNFEQTIITSESIEGNASIDLSFKGMFDLEQQELDKQGVVADANIRITNGALVNVESFKEITKSLKNMGAAKLIISKNKIEAFEKELLQLHFAQLENQLHIENGVITIPRMSIVSNALDLNVSGKHSFENEIDYSFDFRFREVKGKTSTSEFGDIVDDETGFKVYLKMKGTVDNPIFEWDKEQRKQDQKEKREAARDEFKSVIKTGFGVHKNDSSIQRIETQVQPSEKLIMNFDTDSTENAFDPEEKQKRKSKLKLKIEQWKKETEKEEEQFMIIED